MPCAVVSKNATEMIVRFTEPGASYWITAAMKHLNPLTTTVCYTVERESGAGVSSVAVGLGPEIVCPPPGPGGEFADCCLSGSRPVPIVTDETWTSISPWPPSPAQPPSPMCYTYPVPITVPGGAVCGVRVHVDGSLEADAETFCVTFVGAFETAMVPFRAKAGDHTIACEILGLSCVPMATITNNTPAAPTVTAPALPPRGLGWPMEEVEIGL